MLALDLGRGPVMLRWLLRILKRKRRGTAVYCGEPPKIGSRIYSALDGWGRVVYVDKMFQIITIEWDER